MNKDYECYRMIDELDEQKKNCDIQKMMIRESMWRNRLEERVEGLPELSNGQKEECHRFWSKWNVNYNSDWCRLYTFKSGLFDPKYIPDDLYYSRIEEHFNNWNMAESVDDKNYYSVWFPEAKQPRSPVRVINGQYYSEDYHVITKNEAISRCLKEEKVIIKNSMCSDGGFNIKIWDRTTDDVNRLADYIEVTEVHNNFICQEFIKQSEELSSIHRESVNTIRFNTLLFDGKVYVLAAILKMGAGNMCVDNVHWGGVTCGIKPDGSLRRNGSTAAGDIIQTHPSGFAFEGFKVPGYSLAYKMVEGLQEKIGHFRMASWDVAIDEHDRPVLIEVNLKYGNLDFQQWNNGPIFGDLTEAVLDEVLCQ